MRNRVGHCHPVPNSVDAQRKRLAKLSLKPTNNDSVFLDFRVYKGFVNTEIKEHGDDLKIRSVCQEFSLSNGSGIETRILGNTDRFAVGITIRTIENPRL